MTKKLIYISPQFPRNYVNFITALSRHGVSVLGVANDPYDSLSDEVRGALTEYYRVDNMNDYGQLHEAGRFFQQKYGQIDRIESHTEYWIPFESALREDLGVWGRKREESSKSRHKSLMKGIFKSAGVDTARGELVTTLENAKAFCSRVNFPVVLKPDCGVGAADTWRINDENELVRTFHSLDLKGYFIEEFVVGEIVTFDGLTDAEGNILYMNSLTYSSGIMELVVNDTDTYYWTAREIPQDLMEAGKKTLKAFDVREKFFHLEYFRRASDNKLLGLEVNIRPPGGFTVDMWNYADDIDLYDAWAKLISGKGFDTKWSRKNHVFYVSRKDNIRYANGHRAIWDMLGDKIVHYERLSPLFRNALGDEGFLVKGEKFDELLELAKFIQERG